MAVTPPGGTPHTPSGAAGHRSTPGASTGGVRASEILESRFPPGAILAGRYRILSLLGRGGMGEVYRADDLTLGQQVALKFLPESLASDPTGLASFHNEVRLARQIAHPNICRVYDIGSLDGLNFLSMEYVDGEDLSSLLRRIGQLPAHKALEIARQLCAGLAAAHEQGVLHRDLKPANVMIDGRGQARLMDFGLAGIADRMTEADVFAGTPSHMAPEQLAGIEVTVRSDIYSLGLVLYELVTGRPAFASEALVDLIRMHQEEMPAPPSQVAEGVDPKMERAILACLEKDPALRPPGALALSAMLPGGDPLAAALAAGQTPSPEMVAEAGGLTNRLSLRAGWLALGGLLGALLLLLALCDATTLYRRAPLPKPTPVLVDRAQEILKAIDYPVAGRMTGHGYEQQKGYLDWVVRHDKGPRRWAALESGAAPAITFWYRVQGEQENIWRSTSLGRMTAGDPPLMSPGNAFVKLDPFGRLRSLLVVPVFYDTLRDAGRMAWPRLFAAAGLDTARFHPVPPPVVPRTYADERVAWEGTRADDPDTRLVVQAAALRGRPVQFRVLMPWEDVEAARAAGQPSAATRTLNSILSGILLVSLIGGGFALGMRNARKRNADTRGAQRLAWFIFLCCMAAWLFGAHHFVEMQLEINSLVMAASLALLMFGFAWGLYVALEPTARRVWPQLLISWTRLLSGRLNDPLVGRDILVGAAAALGYLLLRTLIKLALWRMTGTLPNLDPLDADTLLGGGYLVHALGVSAFQILQLPLVILLIMVVLRLVLRNRQAAVIVAALLLVLPGALTGTTFERIDNTLLQVMLFVVLLRFGFLALLVALAFNYLVYIYPVTLDVSAWYFPSGLFGIAVLVAMLAYGFRAALGGQPLFGQGLLRE